MKAAVDTAILLDVFKADVKFGPASRQLLNKFFRTGSLLICEVVYAELAPGFETQARLEEVLQRLNVEMAPLSAAAAFLAGARWREYRSRGGPRTRIISDFLIGAHALHVADVLLTRDLDFYRRNFPELAVEYGE